MTDKSIEVPEATVSGPRQQIQKLTWVKTELVHLQEVYETALVISPELKQIIIDVNELTANLFRLIKFTIHLAKQVELYYAKSGRFSLKKTSLLLNQVEEARQVIINHIEFLIDYYNHLATIAGIISNTENALIPKDAYRYTNVLKRYIDLELEKSKDELAALPRIHPAIIQSLVGINRASEYERKELYIDIQRVIARVVKCYIALGGQASVTANATITDSNEIIKKENAIDPYQRLQDSRRSDLDILISQMEWAHHILNRFLLPQPRDYVPREAQRFVRFFEDNEKLLHDFTAFVTDVVKKTSHVNPNKPQKMTINQRIVEDGELVNKEIVRDREIMLIIIDKLPMEMPVTYSGRTIQIEKGCEFIIKFGVAYFSESLNASPVGYVQVFLPHATLDVFNIPDANELYVGRKVYVSLNETQTNLWREIVLLSLMAVGIKYDVLPSKYLQRYLTKKL